MPNYKLLLTLLLTVVCTEKTTLSSEHPSGYVTGAAIVRAAVLGATAYPGKEWWEQSQNQPLPSLPNAISWGLFAMQGKRYSMEDTHSHVLGFDGNPNHDFFAIYDGHGGTQTAMYAQAHLHEYIARSLNEPTSNSIEQKLTQAVEQFDQDLSQKNVKDGACAIAACILDKELYIINVGDSRAVLCSHGNAIDLSVDQKPDNPVERARIEQAGGTVRYSGGWKTPIYYNWNQPNSINTQQELDNYKNYIHTKHKGETVEWVDVWRVQGLAIARTLGDYAQKYYGKSQVIATPEITHHTIQPDDQFLILACDGVWDVLSSQEAVDIVKNALQENDNDPSIAAETLGKTAYDKGSDDNISAMVIIFPHNETQ